MKPFSVSVSQDPYGLGMFFLNFPDPKWISPQTQCFLTSVYWYKMLGMWSKLGVLAGLGLNFSTLDPDQWKGDWTCMTQGCFGVLKIATGLKGQDSYSTMNIRGDMGRFEFILTIFFLLQNHQVWLQNHQVWFLISTGTLFLFIVISNFCRTLYFSHTEFSPDFFPIKNIYFFPPAKKQLLQKAPGMLRDGEAPWFGSFPCS